MAEFGDLALTSKKIVLHFPKRLVEQPMISNLVKHFKLDFNILKAQVTPKEEGLMVLELQGTTAAIKKGLEYLAQLGVGVQSLSQDITRNEARCTHCGACVTICPADALVLDMKTRKVAFKADKCIACELCIKACPPRAMEVHF